MSAKSVLHLWFCHNKCLFKSVDNHSSIKCIIDFPANDTATIPVDYSSQIQKSVSDWNICNVNRPRLIWSVYDGVTEKIRTYLGLLHPLGEIHLRIDWINIHFIHITTCFTASHMMTSVFELYGHLSCAPSRIVCMKTINNRFTSQLFV